MDYKSKEQLCIVVAVLCVLLAIVCLFFESIFGVLLWGGCAGALVYGIKTHTL
jgi:hypothetical protein